MSLNYYVAIRVQNRADVTVYHFNVAAKSSIEAYVVGRKQVIEMYAYDDREAKITVLFARKDR